MSREASKGLTVEALVQQWRTPLGYAPSYARFMKVLKHLGLSNLQAVTEDGQARIETELLSRKWTRRAAASPALIAAITDADLFWDQLDLAVRCLGGDPARARAWVEHKVLTTRLTPEQARTAVLETITQGCEIQDVPRADVDG
jgi:hypothetical protein